LGGLENKALEDLLVLVVKGLLVNLENVVHLENLVDLVRQENWDLQVLQVLLDQLVNLELEVKMAYLGHRESVAKLDRQDNLEHLVSVVPLVKEDLLDQQEKEDPPDQLALQEREVWLDLLENVEPKVKEVNKVQLELQEHLVKEEKEAH